MRQSERTRKLLIEHYQRYPQMQIRDVFKFLFQSTFGCEHLVSSQSDVTQYIQKELENHKKTDTVEVEALDGGFCRVHFSCLEHGLAVKTLGALFFESAKIKAGNKDDLEQKLQVARELVADATLGFRLDEFDSELEKWRMGGYPPVHHSDTFRQAYCPAYRVISNRFAPYIPLFSAIDRLLENGSVILAIEGGSASGKSTLGELLASFYDCNLLHIDDFFLQPEQRSAARYAEVGGNFDRERFLREVLVPLSEHKPINYRPFDCSTLKIKEGAILTPKKLTIIEGAYSMHPELSPYYDLSIFLDVSAELQQKRIEKRNTPDMAKRFFEEWIHLEEKYFSALNVKGRCDIVIPIS